VRLFQDAKADAAEQPWSRVVTNREVGCAACGRKIGPGEECHLRRRADVREFRCAECGLPAAEAPPSAS
jgi:hypothetical protein